MVALSVTDALLRARLARAADLPPLGQPPSVLVTGIAGLLGRRFAVRWPSSALRGLDLAAGWGTTIVGSVTDRAAVMAAVQGMDTVVHLAGLHAPHVGTAAPAEFRRVNVDGTCRLLDAAIAAGLRRFVFASSTSVYGAAMVDPVRAVFVDESLEPQPRDIYDETKLDAEALVLAADGAFREGTIVLRIGRCFAEPAPMRAFHRFHRGIAAADVVTALERAVRTETGGVFNIVARTRLNREDAAALKRDPAGVLTRRYPGVSWERPCGVLPVIDRIYDGSKAARLLGFESRFDSVSWWERRQRQSLAGCQQGATRGG